MSGAALVVVVGTVPWLVVLGVAWFLAGVASQFILVGVNAAVLGGPGGNRGGAVSVVQAFRFGGAAFSPLLLTPVYGAIRSSRSCCPPRCSVCSSPWP